MNQKDYDELATRLGSHPDFRVIRRLDPARTRPTLEGSRVRRAAIVDTETTGTDATRDRIIELAVVVFEYDAESGEIGRVLDSYDGLEDPGFPIPPESTAIHGITDAMVAGQKLDDARVESLLKQAGLVIAHNARFDRGFLESRLPVFGGVSWGCSWQEVPWSAAGIESTKLEYLAYRHGFFYEGHRAEIDCLALLEVLGQPLADTGGTALKALLESARKPSYRLWANNSPFESKDVLKQRGYRWVPEKRMWYGEIASREAVEAELAWLKDSVYGGKSVALDLEEFDAKSRYSERAGKPEKVRT
ncbi:MAG TPA: 3'-5' exonuclease [Steroidobacteraceae bacterium]